MNSFSNDIEEITFVVRNGELTIKNFVESSNAKSLVNTQVTYEKDEFESYDIEGETDITFCLKEFKGCLLFGSAFDLSLAVLYERKGRPILFQYCVPDMFEVNYTLATLNDESSTQMTTQNASQQSVTLNNTTLLGAAANSSIIPSRANTSSQNSQNISNKNDDKIQKNLKRTLYDSSNNQTFLNESIDNITLNEDKNAKKNAPSAESDNDSTVSSRYSNLELRSNENTTKLPPSKKLKSIIHSFFEENDDEDDVTISSEKTINKTENKTVYIDETSSSGSDSD